ncbi:DUF2784 domain-containing protein [Actinoplanes sp. NPDC024001]|uniref:DUF2784 domain-containing protein n=1 Tax=Actinoplanes sp. NPDC024001 TaxID=3154598 RepID=UPI0033E982FE
MGFRILADATMLVHFAFLAWVVFGGFLAWRWPSAIWAHLAAALWGLSSVVFGLHCPLTWVEERARERAGEAGLSGGFIDTYLTGVIYPERYAGLAQALVAVTVAVSWAGAAHRRRVRARRPELS